MFEAVCGKLPRYLQSNIGEVRTPQRRSLPRSLMPYYFNFKVSLVIGQLFNFRRRWNEKTDSSASVIALWFWSGVNQIVSIVWGKWRNVHRGGGGGGQYTVGLKST